MDRGVQEANTKVEPWTGGYPNEVHKGSKIGHRPEDLRRRDHTILNLKDIQMRQNML